MKLCIHRGTKEIGGTCVEVEAQGKRLILDVGLPLDAPDDENVQKTLVPDISGFSAPDDNLLGVVISHSHVDHYGLARHIPQKIPVWIGQAAHTVLTAASRYAPNDYAVTDPHFLIGDIPVEIGPFRITPYRVDHSAFDAYALLIEADGKRVFYSGDFRGHGRTAKRFEMMVARPPSGIDVLLMEGTSIGRVETDGRVETENDLENQFIHAFKKTKGLHFVWTSSQNIDRLVTIFRAAKRTGRLFLIDLYTAVVLQATGRDTIPQSSWSDVRLYIPYRQRVFIKKRRLFDDLDRHKVNRVYPKDLPSLAGQAVMLFRPLLMSDNGIQESLHGAALTYSMWKGYLDQDRSVKVLEWLDNHGISWTPLHTSGHASVADLRKFASALAPRSLVPIHSFEPDRFKDYFDHVMCYDDGEWWRV